MKKILILALILSSFLTLQAADKDNVHMFPKAKEGFIRYVIEVPKTENDYDHKVELLIGKTILADCNQRSFYAKVSEVDLKGWGYKYIEVNDINSGVRTMMMCKEPKVEKFISVYAPEMLIRRYNSRLPMVVYIPNGYEVKYRVWSASENIKNGVNR